MKQSVQCSKGKTKVEEATYGYEVEGISAQVAKGVTGKGVEDKEEKDDGNGANGELDCLCQFCNEAFATGWVLLSAHQHIVQEASG